MTTERTVINKRWTVLVKITREEMVEYKDTAYRSGSGSDGTRLEESIDEMEVTITQDTIAGAVGSAMSVLEIRSPKEERTTRHEREAMKHLSSHGDNEE